MASMMGFSSFYGLQKQFTKCNLRILELKFFNGAAPMMLMPSCCECSEYYEMLGNNKCLLNISTLGMSGV